MNGAQNVVKYSILLAIITVVLFVFGILLQTMGEAVPVIGNNTNDSLNASRTADGIAYSGLNGSLNISNQLPTTGNILGVLLILAVSVAMILLLVFLIRKVKSPGGS